MLETPTKQQRAPDSDHNRLQRVGLDLEIEQPVINFKTVNDNRLIGSIIEQTIFGNEEACAPKSIPMADSPSSLHQHLNYFECCRQIRLIVGFFHLIDGRCTNVASPTINSGPRATRRHQRCPLPTCTPARKEADAIAKVTDTLTELRRHALTLQREGHCSDCGTRQSGMTPTRQINKHVNNNSNPHADNISRGLTHFLIAAADAARRKEAVSGR
jgi:hypothetical protein